MKVEYMTLAQHPKMAKLEARFRSLNELAEQLQPLVSSEDFFQEAVNTVQGKFGFLGLQLWVAGADGSAVLKAQAGSYRALFQTGQSISPESGMVGFVIKSRRSQLTNAALPSETLSASEPSSVSSAPSELILPLIQAGEAIGVLCIHSDRLDAFDEEEIISLEGVASQLATAMANQKLYSDARSFNRKLQQAVEDKTLELRRAHERILDQQRLLQKENKALKALVDHDSRGMEIVGKSPSILGVITMVDKIAPTTATVLIQGESGTGKELIARRLHFKSDRTTKPYVTVNCGALQESLLESELFGHEKGAFTGAVAQKIGLCETADNGTIFLDEIGELSLGIQAKLLRFLQEGEFYRIGGKKPIRVDVRVVSATNRDLEQEVKENRFREDLFYRLNTITLRMPPLRKRKDDIPTLIDHFLKNSRFGGSGQQIKRIDPRVIEVLSNYDWPGNIRELQNTIERLKILAENNEIRLEDIPFGIRMPKTKAEAADFTVDMSLEDVEKSHILRTLAYNHGNKTKTAHSLGITIKTLYNKLHRYGILKPESASTENNDTQQETQTASPSGGLAKDLPISAPRREEGDHSAAYSVN